MYLPFVIPKVPKGYVKLVKRDWDKITKKVAEVCNIYDTGDGIYLNGTEEDAPVISHNALKLTLQRLLD